MQTNCTHVLFYTEIGLLNYLNAFDLKKQKTWAKGFGPCPKCEEVVDLLSSFCPKDSMIKFIPQTIKGQTSVYEIEVKPVTLLEDPSLSWRAKPGEILYKVISPKNFAEEKWWSFYMYDSAEKALEVASGLLNENAARTARKDHTELDEANLSERIAAITLVNL